MSPGQRIVRSGPEATSPETKRSPLQAMPGEKVCRAVNPQPGSIFIRLVIRALPKSRPAAAAASSARSLPAEVRRPLLEESADALVKIFGLRRPDHRLALGFEVGGERREA